MLGYYTGKGLAWKWSEPLGPFPSQTFSRIIPHIALSRVYSTRTYLPMKMEQCSETSAYKFRKPGNHPKESIQHSVHGEILKSRWFLLFLFGVRLCLLELLPKWAPFLCSGWFWMHNECYWIDEWRKHQTTGGINLFQCHCVHPESLVYPWGMRMLRQKWNKGGYCGLRKNSTWNKTKKD